MKQLANCLSLVLLGSAAIAAGCSTSASNSNDGGPNGSGGGGGASSMYKLVALTPDATGYVDVGSTVPDRNQGRLVRLRRRHRLGRYARDW